jgi:outer membrane receptor protein involved in Fe transport
VGTIVTTMETASDIRKDQAIKMRADANIKSGQYRDAINTPSLHADSYWILNGRVSWVPNQTVEILAFVTNITDEVYLTSGVNAGGQAYYRRPREWATSSAKF